MERKNALLSQVKVIDESQGIVEAFTNTMGAIDLDGDIIEPYAFDQSIYANLPIPALVGHDPNQVVGKVVDARPVEMGDGTAKLWTRIQFNMDTQAGRDAFSNVKGGYVREWSVGFNIPAGALRTVREAGKTVRRIANLDWVEVSSVLRGASPGTGTIAAKAAGAGARKEALPPHETATDDSPWDGPAAEARLPLGDGMAYEDAFAYIDDGADPDLKGSYRFIHHEVSADGNVGAANTRACVTGIAVLNGARGGTTIPDADIEGVYAHLASHLRDAGLEPPELRSATTSVTASAADVAADLATIRLELARLLLAESN